MKKSHVVTILNQKLMVRSDASDASVAEIATFVSDRIQEILSGTKTASMLTASLLACLNLADELRRQQKLREVAGLGAAQKVREIVRLIDAHLEDGEKIAL